MNLTVDDQVDYGRSIGNALNAAYYQLSNARDLIHRWNDENDLPNARSSPEVAKIGEAMGNIELVLKSFQSKGGLPLE